MPARTTDKTAGRPDRLGRPAGSAKAPLGPGGGTVADAVPSSEVHSPGEIAAATGGAAARPILFDEAIAAHYESWFETPEGRRADRLEKGLLARMLRLLGPPGSLLEVGCGTGHFGRWLAQEGWHVVGLDHSPAMLSRAGDLPRVLGEAEFLPFPAASFDAVALITVLEFLPDARAALTEAWRVARRGLLLGVLNRLSPIAWARRWQARRHPSVYDAARFYSPWQLARLVRAAAGRPIVLHWHTTLWPRWLPLEGFRPGGAFIALAAGRSTAEEF